MWLAGAATLSGLTFPARAADDKGRFGELVDLAAPATAHSLELFWTGIERHPSLMLAGAAATAVPLVAATAAVVRALSRRARFRARMRELSAGSPVTGGRRPNVAWLEIESHQAPPLQLGELVRIGGSADCDLTLGDSGIAGIHALIQRTPESEFIIFDVSDESEGRLVVNGTPSRQCYLSDGDRIEIGGACVVFHTKWTSQAAGEPALA